MYFISYNSDMQSLQIFAHVQKFAAIILLSFGWEPNENFHQSQSEMASQDIMMKSHENKFSITGYLRW